MRAPAALHDWVHRWWGRTELWAAGVRTDVAGLANVSPTAPQIFVANHQSIFDIFTILAYVPASVRFVAKRELGRIPIFSLAMRAAGHVFIDRHDRRGAAEAMRAAGERMKRERGVASGACPPSESMGPVYQTMAIRAPTPARACRPGSLRSVIKALIARAL